MKDEIDRIMHNAKVICRAIETYGKEAQTIVAIEELAELQKELTKALRGKLNKEHLIEELADASIMMTQILDMYEIDYQDVIKAKDIKIARLENRLNEEEEE